MTKSLPQFDQGATRRAVMAQPSGSIGGSAPAANPDLKGLMEGLSSFNPAINQFISTQAQENQRLTAISDRDLREQQTRDEHNARQDAAVAGQAAGETQEGPVSALTGVPIDLPPTVPVAYGREFRSAWSNAVGHRAGVQMKQEAFDEYAKTKDLPDFNPDTFMAQQRQKALAGITDPKLQATVGAHMDEMEAEVRGEAMRGAAKKREEEKVATMSTLARDAFTGNMKPEELQSAYGVFLQHARDLQFDPKQAAQFAFAQIVHESNKMGGSPELFDVFDRVDPTTGRSIADMNPELKAQADQARQQAQAHRDKATMQAAEVGNGQTLDAINKDLETNPFAVTESRLLTHFTKFGAIQSPAQYASIMSKARDAQQALLAQQQLEGLADKGELSRVNGGTQQKIMEARLGPAINTMWDAAHGGDASGVAQAASAMMQAHSRFGATVPFEQLKRFIETNVTNLPAAEGASAGFKAAAEVYRAMSANPQYRDLYFTDDVSKVMDSYVTAVNGKSDPKVAYTAAYQSVSPEAKAAAEAFSKTPEFTKLVTKDAQNITGASWLPTWLGGDRPQNADVVQSDLTNELRKWRAANPGAPLSSAQQHLEGYTKSNWALDKTSGAAIKIPPGVSAQAAQEALTDFSAAKAKELDLKSRSDGDWSVQYIKQGDGGFYTAVASNGSAKQVIGNVNLQQLITDNGAKKVLSPAEQASLGAMRDGLRGGSMPQVDPALLAKAEALGAIQPQESKLFRDQANKTFLDRLSSIPKMTLGDPSLTNLQFNPRMGNNTVDNQATAKVASELLTMPVYGSGMQHQSYAASLVTMGEGFMPRRYSDPARGAGDNIGMGYNLAANQATVNEDLKRSGVPAEAIEAVKSGKAELTPDQAKRLLLVSLPRYEKSVKDTAEATAPGLWNKMLPQQKAVMIDIAYQLGSSDSFKHAWSSLAKGDMDSFQKEVKVFYTDKNGAKKEDTRRGALRASMLAGVSHWDETISKYGSFPSTKLAAAAIPSN